MGKKFLYFLLFLLFVYSKAYPHGFAMHVAHYPDIIALNDSYKSLIENSKYKPYFLYGSIFPDIQYANNYKATIHNLDQQIRDTKKGGIKIFSGLSYLPDTTDIPDYKYPLGIDTHDDKYGMQFAEKLLESAGSLRNDIVHLGNGTDQKNIQIAFALGYYMHLATDIACHDFLVPRVSAMLNLGDLQLIKGQTSFSSDPNSQMEGIIEGICDH
jgi:hypothetical protein